MEGKRFLSTDLICVHWCPFVVSICLRFCRLFSSRVQSGIKRSRSRSYWQTTNINQVSCYWLNRRCVGRFGFRQRVVAGWRTMKTIHLRGPLRVIPLPPQAQPCIRVFAFYDSLFKKSNADRSRFFQFFADFLFSHTPHPSPSGLACGSALSIHGHQLPLAG